MLHGTLFGEMELHRQYAASFDIEESELLKTEPSAVNTAYTSYMLNHAQRGDAAAVAACLLACAWSYNYIGRALDNIRNRRIILISSGLKHIREREFQRVKRYRDDAAGTGN